MSHDPEFRPVAAHAPDGRLLTMRSRRRKLLIGCLVPVVAVVLWVLIEHVRGEHALRAWRATMLARGEKLTLATLLPPPPRDRKPVSPDEASALLGLTALRDFGSDSLSTLTAAAPGRARLAWGASPNEAVPWGTNTWEELAGRLAPLAPALEQLRSELANRTWWVNYAYEQGPAARVMELFPFINAGRALAARSQLDLQQGDLETAREHLHALLALPEDGMVGRSLIGRVASLAVGSTAILPTWQALQAPGWTDPQLASLQAAWERQRFLDELALCFAMERATIGDWWFQQCRTNQQGFRGVLDFSPSAGSSPPTSGSIVEAVLSPLLAWGAKPRAYALAAVWRQAWLAQAQLHYDQEIQAAIDYIRFLATVRSRAATRARWGPASELSDRWFPRAGETAGWRDRYDRVRFWPSRMLMPKLSATIDESCKLETGRSLTLAAIALRRHELRHGRAAPSLEALVPEFLPEVPVDLMDGQPLRYRPAGDGTFLLYSVGTDETDDGGSAEPSGDKRDLPSLWDGRDWVWPRPEPPAPKPGTGSP
jgi:hypothetical protein